MTIKMLRKQDYSKVIDFAITGMHFDWYMSSKFILEAYGRYFLYMELRQYRTELVLKMRCQIFRQIV